MTTITLKEILLEILVTLKCQQQTLNELVDALADDPPQKEQEYL